METYKDIYPEGVYKVRAMGIALTESKTSGNPYLTMKVEVVEPRKIKTDEPIVLGGHRYVNLYLSPAKIEETRAVLEAAGLSAAGVENIEEFDIAGFEFLAKCKHDEYNGKPQHKFELSQYWNTTPTSVSTAWMENITPINRTKLAGVNSMLGLAKQGWKPSGDTQQQQTRRSAF